MAEKFEMERGHELGSKKSHKQHMIRRNIHWKTYVLIGVSTFKSGGKSLRNLMFCARRSTHNLTWEKPS
jgi:hypothetical protein